MLGLPFLGIKFTGVDASVLPRDHSARVVNDALETEFPPNRTRPVYVAARGGRDDRAAVERYARRLGELPGRGRRAAACSPPTASTGSTSCAPGAPLGERAKEFVRDVRAVDGAGAGARRRRDRRRSSTSRRR